MIIYYKHPIEREANGNHYDYFAMGKKFNTLKETKEYIIKNK